jgi:nitrogen fixation protein NifU and related proteins
VATDDYHYNDTVLGHIAEPHNLGELEGADSVGTGTNPACGDEVTLYLKFDGDLVSDSKMEVLGCGAITASMSALTDLVRGKTTSELEAITHEEISASLGGLPKHKRHCAQLAQRVVLSALSNRG